MIQPQVALGQELSFTVSGQTQAAQFQIFFNEAMLAGSVSTTLQQRLDVVRLDVRATDTVITGTLPWNYRASVTVRARNAFVYRSDVEAIIASAFFTAAGNMPQIAPASGLELPDVDLNFKWTTAVVVAGVAVLVLAWKF